MYTWLCRVMAVIFTLNVLSPAYSLTPDEVLNLSKRPTQRKQGFDPRTPRERDAARSLETATTSRDSLETLRDQYVAQYMEEYEAAMDAFHSAAAPDEIDAAYAKLDSLRRTGSSVNANYQNQIGAAVRQQMEANRVITSERDRRNNVAVADNTRVHNPRQFSLVDEEIRNSAPHAFNCPDADDFLEKLKNNKFENSEEMLNYLDPMGLNCHDYLAVAYAAETLYYILEGFTDADSVPAEQAEELKVFFAHAQKRVSESLKRLNAVSSQEETLYMARGTMRILLALLQQAVDANHLQLTEKKLYFVHPTISRAAYKKREAARAAEVKARSLEGRGVYLSLSYDDFVKQNSYFSLARPKAEKGMTVEEVTLSSLDKHPAAKKAMENGTFNNQVGFRNNPMSFLSSSDGVPQHLGQEFLAELRQFKEKKPEANSADYTLMLLDLQYAAQFGVLTADKDLLVKMVNLFEEKPGTNIRGEYTQRKATDLHTEYEAALSVLFNGVYETLNGFNVPDAYVTFEFLEDMAGPSHSTPTRVLALGTLGMLTQPTDSTDEPVLRSERILSADGERTNKYWLSYNSRAQLGRYVADIYAPLQRTHYLAMEDYGLESEQMLALSNQLANIYMNFLPLKAPTVTLGPCMKVEKMDTKNQTIITRGHFLQQRQGYFVDGNCQQRFTDGGTFVFTSNGTVEMLLDNRINWKKQSDEMTAAGMEILGEAMFWVVGGAVIGGAFRGLRLLAGAAKALPRAIRSGKIIYNTTKGTRFYRWRASIQRAGTSLKKGYPYMTKSGFERELGFHHGIGYTADPVVPSQPGLMKAPLGASMGGPMAPSPVSRSVTVTALDAYSGLPRVETLIVPMKAFVGTPLPTQRVLFMRMLGQRGLLNPKWTSADRIAYKRALAIRGGADELLSSGHTLETLSDGYFPGLFLKNHPTVSALWKSYLGTVKLFYVFDWADKGMYYYFNPGFTDRVMRKQQEAVQAEQAKYDSLSPEAQAEIEALAGKVEEDVPSAVPADILGQVGGTPKEEFSAWDLLFLPSTVFRGLVEPPFRPEAGASLSQLLTGAREGLSATGLVSSPFEVDDATKMQIKIQALQATLTRARIGNLDTQLTQSAEAMLKNIKKDIKQVESFLKDVRNAWPGDWSREESYFRNLANEVQAEVKASAKLTNLNERDQKLQAAREKYNAGAEKLMRMIEQKQNQLLLAREAPNGEAAFFQTYLARFEVSLYNLIEQIPPEKRLYYPVQTKDFEAEYVRAGEAHIAKVRAIAAKKGLFLDKYNELITAVNAFREQETQLIVKLDQACVSSGQPQRRAGADYEDMVENP